MISVILYNASVSLETTPLDWLYVLTVIVDLCTTEAITNISKSK